MRIRLSGTNIIGTILRNDTVVCSYEVSGSGASIGESASSNTFLLGTSFVPNPATTSPGERSAYLKYVYIRDGKLYSGANYTSTATQWVPDSENSVTYYALLCNTDYVSYNRFGTTDEEISIDYT